MFHSVFRFNVLSPTARFATIELRACLMFGCQFIPTNAIIPE